MRLDIELKNYRTFPIDVPARFSIGHGFTGVVGPNNAGKSTLLRFFYEFRNHWQRMSGPTGNMAAAMRPEDSDGVGFHGVRDPDEVFSNLNSLGIEVGLTLHHDHEQAADTPIEDQHLEIPRKLTLSVSRAQTWTLRVDEPANVIQIADLAWHDTVLTQGGTPILEFGPWFEVFATLSNALYVGPFRNALNAGASGYYDLNVGTAFIQDWNRFRAGSVKADSRAALRLTEEIKRIFALEELDITASDDDTTLQLVIDGQPYRLDEVGGGLTHFIVALAYAATRRPPMILIDEPELNLHPSLQLDFLTTVGSYASTGVLFATHSLGLARAAGERLYTVRRVAPGRSDVRELEGTPRLAEFLGELSLSGYQELGYNKVLLVEGPTDVTVFQRLLRLYGIEHEVVLLPLGGGELINAGVEPQLEEVLRLTPEVFAVVDSERSAHDDDPPESVVAFSDICAALGINAHILHRRAIENYFNERAIKLVKGDAYRALGPYERLKDADPAWGKPENWRIAGELTRDELDETDLGQFLATLAAA